MIMGAQRPLRILQILRSPIGGLYRHVIDLSQALLARGHALGLVMDSTLSDAQTNARLAEIEASLQLGVHRLPIPRVLGIADLTTPFALRKLARSLDVDVLHGHGAKGGFHARLARIGNHRAAVYTPHGGVLHFDQASVGGKLFLHIERALLHQTDAIVFESAYAQKIYFERIAQPPCPAPVIHNGLADDEFKAVRTAKNACDFVYVGELRDLKGIFYLLEALVDVTAQDGKPATLVVAGDGSALGEVESRIVQLSLQDRVELVGVQPAREMFARGRCVVVPSLAESLPYVVLEAAAAARPVIATDVGGIGEIFGPTAPALIAPADSVALRVAMQAFMDDAPGAAKEMKQRLAHVRATFSLARMTGDVETLYGEATARF